jgi:hypothetical protein
LRLKFKVRFSVFNYFLLFIGCCWHLLAPVGKRWQIFIPTHLRFPQTTGRSMGLANKSVVLYESHQDRKKVEISSGGRGFLSFLRRAVLRPSEANTFVSTGLLARPQDLA